MKRPNKILTAGLLLVPSLFALRLFQVKLPDFLQGALLGLGIGLEFLGIYAEKHDLSKLRNFKLKILGKLTN
ncbi:MAG TPA: hypothetical protein VHO03_07830 [Ignavibacteriales bacterium]|nr:hypothetical protein [Ignavibacteriales bacterium]